MTLDTAFFVHVYQKSCSQEEEDTINFSQEGHMTYTNDSYILNIENGIYNCDGQILCVSEGSILWEMDYYDYSLDGDAGQLPEIDPHDIVNV